jgi:hypothetical protein
VLRDHSDNDKSIVSILKDRAGVVIYKRVNNWEGKNAKGWFMDEGEAPSHRRFPWRRPEQRERIDQLSWVRMQLVVDRDHRIEEQRVKLDG